MEAEIEIALLFFPDPRADPPRPSPYVQAAFNGNVDVVEYAARRYPAHVDHTDTVRVGVSAVHGCTALLAAVIGGRTEVARVLLKAGASTEARDCTGATPLCEAVFHGHVDIVRLLREGYGADVNARNAFGWTPLHVSIDRGHRWLTEYLMGKGGADISLTTPEGYTPLHVAAMMGRTQILTNLLKLKETHSILLSSDREEYTPSPLYLAAYNYAGGTLTDLFRSCNIPEDCWRDVELIISVRWTFWNKTVQAYRNSWQVLERCMGPREPALFLEISNMATDLWHTTRKHEISKEDYHVIFQQAVVFQQAPTRYVDLPLVWTTVQEMLTKAAERFEKNQLCSLRRGHLLPQTVAEEVGKWGIDCLVLRKVVFRTQIYQHIYQGCNLQSQVVVRSEGSQFTPDYNRFLGFLLKVLVQVQDRSRVVREEFGCEEDTPLRLLYAIFRCFQYWLVLLRENQPQCSAEKERCDELGREFVSRTLHLPNGNTLLWAVLHIWCEHEWSEHDTHYVPLNPLLVQALLDWGADKVINTPFSPHGDTPLHYLCRFIKAKTLMFKEVSPLLVNYGAHLDSVNSAGETAHAMLKPKLDDYLQQSTKSKYYQMMASAIAEEMAQVAPPSPPLLYCLVSRRLAQWGVAGSRELEQLLPAAVLKYVRLHYWSHDNPLWQ